MHGTMYMDNARVGNVEPIATSEDGNLELTFSDGETEITIVVTAQTFASLVLQWHVIGTRKGVRQA